MIKPPLGIEPQKFWIEKRIKSLLAAIDRAVTHPHVTIHTINWAGELKELLEVYNYKWTVINPQPKKDQDE